MWIESKQQKDRRNENNEQFQIDEDTQFFYLVSKIIHDGLSKVGMKKKNRHKVRGHSCVEQSTDIKH